MLRRASVAPRPIAPLKETPIGMHIVRRIMLAAGIVAVLVAVGIAGTAAFAMTAGIVRPNAAASPSPSQSPGSFKSNEDATHEKGETAAQEAAENSGQRPGGHGPGGPGGTCSNETSAHETGETAAREAAEPKGQCPAPTTTPGSTATQ
jgi:hypothetical protein